MFGQNLFPTGRRADQAQRIESEQTLTDFQTVVVDDQIENGRQK